jgi:hypothetical protein
MCVWCRKSFFFIEKMMCKHEILVEFSQNLQSCVQILSYRRSILFKLHMCVLLVLMNILMFDLSRKSFFFYEKIACINGGRKIFAKKRQFFVYISIECFTIVFKLYTRFFPSGPYILMWVSFLGYCYFQKKWLPKSRFLPFFPHVIFNITSEWSLVSVLGFLLTLYHIKSYATVGSTRHSSF